MQLTADFRSFFVCLVVAALAAGASSERKRGKFREVVVEFEASTNSTEDESAASESSGPMGRSRPWKPNDTLGKGSSGRGAATRHRPREEDISEPTAYRHDSSHCKNGGTGFLRSFCFCMSGYTGRYCEHRVNASCDAVIHGSWIYRNCSYCQCLDGVLECRRHELEGCGDKEEAPKHHSYHEDGVALEMDSHSNGCLPQRPSSLVPLLILVLLVHRILWLQYTSVR